MTTTCCTDERHRAMKADPSTWISLEMIGVQVVETDEEEPEFTVEMRNCGDCGSTLAIRR